MLIFGPRRSLRIQICCNVFLLLLPAFLLSQESGLGGDEPVADFAQTRFPIEQDGFLLIPVRAFNENGLFALNTGATYTVFDRRFRPMLGAAKSVEKIATHSGSQEFELFSAPVIQIGQDSNRINWSGEVAVCADFTVMRKILEVENCGFLGMDFLRSKIVRFNFDEGFVQFPRESTLETSHTEQLRIFKSGPHVLAKLPDAGYLSFRIDTADDGCSLCLTSEMFKRLMKKGKIAFVENSNRAEMNRITVTRMGFLESFEFGPHRFHNLEVREGAANQIQLNFLRRFEVEIDFPKQLARFRPGKQIAMQDHRDLIGLKVVGSSGQYFADVADSSSIAALAGIQTRDQILQFNGVKAAEVPVTRIRRHLRPGPGAEVRILFSHEGVVKEAVMQLPNEPNAFPSKSPHEHIVPVEGFDE